MNEKERAASSGDPSSIAQTILVDKHKDNEKLSDSQNITQKDWPCSWFQSSFDTKPKATTLLAWLQWCSGPDAKALVANVRAVQDKDERDLIKKYTLPAITTSATYKTRDTNIPLDKKILTYNGIICVDIDHVDEPADLIKQLRCIPYIISALPSASGLGVVAFAATANTDYHKHKIYWAALADDIAERTGYGMDDKTKDVTRLRYATYDPSTEINLNPEPFEIPEGWEEITVPALPKKRIDGSTSEIAADVDAIVTEYERLHAEDSERCVLGDSTYHLRYAIGTGLKHQFGDAGLSLYRRICATYDGTHPRTPDEEFRGFPAPSGKTGEITIGSFFYIMKKEFGILRPAHDYHLPLDGIPRHFREIAETTANVYGCPVEFTVTAMFAACAAVVGKKAYLRTKYINYPQLWMALVAPPGVGKSPALSFFFHRVRSIDAARHREFEKAAREYTKAPAAGEAPAPPRRYTVADITPEKRAELMAQNGWLSIVSDELKTYVDNVNRYNQSGELSSLLSDYSNETYTLDRKNGDSFIIENPVLNIIGTIQPAVFAQTFGTKAMQGSGFLPRWLISWNATYNPQRYTDEELPDEIARRWESAVDSWDGQAEVQEYTLSPEAAAIYAKYFNELQERMAEMNEADPLREVLAKLQINVLRWCLIAAILQDAVDLPADGVTRQISAGTMLYAVDCMAYFEASAVRAIKSLQHAAASSRPLSTEQLVKDAHKLFPDFNRTKLAEALGISRVRVAQCLRKN